MRLRVEYQRCNVGFARRIHQHESAYVEFGGLNSIKGVEYFCNLEELYCDCNQLVSIDVSGLKSLRVLECYNNQLESIDVSGLKSLRELWCYNNPLTSLHLSGNTALETLFCHECSLSALDVSGCLSLVSLLCINNQLTELDIANCPKLKYITCYSNNIQGAAMDALIDNLPNWMDDFYNSGYLRIIDEDDVDEGNVCTTEHVAIAKSKDWDVMSTKGYYDGSTAVGINAVRTRDQYQFYDLNGRKRNALEAKGITIVRRADNTTQKVVLEK